MACLAVCEAEAPVVAVGGEGEEGREEEVQSSPAARAWQVEQSRVAKREEAAASHPRPQEDGRLQQPNRRVPPGRGRGRGYSVH